jgi:predicted O-methyltransferase YrrM
LDEKVDRAFAVIQPSQQKQEVAALARVVEERGWRTIVEIGRADGGTLYLLANAAPPGSLIVSVDVVDVGPATRFQLSRFAPGRRVEIVTGDSGAQTTLERARGLLGRRPLDFLFIDGDHTYTGVRRDYELWAPLVGSGGAVGFHDIRPGPGSGDVHRFWAELEGKKTEIVADTGQASYGIGLLDVIDR